ncbi:deoxyribose-phosphate aldolase [Paraburkholderia bannensis]|uniref:Deoxyribose-phosphate aldolase n=1 Tax=Paraburkholderia bannensis TaxID=765414 RepID=A0A7W9WQA4_9BURK|nr:MULTISPECIES: deoxyribose-phosphate aldolase [Paraburkholderia]MBB3256941.1 deoxyribose-phosphate aldolase [Paraburkholderia sp. WP4_3_2]MBB6101895.1 deoxyribose-phosphate aldolase [Paraburkholderia bannensis]
MDQALTRNQLAERALQALHLIDLTSLNDDDTDASIAALAASADTPVGTPTALCVFPRFVGTARAALAAKGLALPIATVTNFPAGAADPQAAARETAEAIALGADEVDVVFPYRALLAGDAQVGRELVAQCRVAAGDKCLKVILETGELRGELRDAALIRRASEIAIEAGADFIKTSTGKVPVNATLDAAAAMLAAIREAGRTVGFKAAGGVRTAQEAAAYLALAERELGVGSTVPAKFRFGASGLLGSLLATLGHGKDAQRPAAY